MTAIAKWRASVPILLAGVRIETITVALAASGGIAVSLLGPALALLPVALIGVLWASVRAPGILLALYLLIPYYKGSLGYLFPVDVTLILAAVNGFQVVVLLAAGFRFKGSVVGISLWILLAVVVLAGVTWASGGPIALDRAIIWYSLILIPSAAAVRVGSDARFVDQFLTTFLGAGAIIVLAGFPGAFASERLILFGQNTILSGQIASMTVLIMFFWVLRVAPAAVRWPSAVLLPLGLIEAVASGSRGPILAGGIVLAMAVLRRLLSRRTLSRSDVGLVLVGVASAAAFLVVISRLPGQSLARFLLLSNSLTEGSLADTSAGTRVDLFETAMTMFVQQPLFGYGTGGFAAYAQTHGLPAYAYPHNDLLQLASELGIIGVGLFAGLVAIALVRRLPDDPRWRTVRASFLFMLVNSLVSGDIYGDRLLWGLMVILIACPSVLAHEAEPAVLPRRSEPLRLSGYVDR